jgi:hypothetical protein
MSRSMRKIVVGALVVGIAASQTGCKRKRAGAGDDTSAKDAAPPRSPTTPRAPAARPHGPGLAPGTYVVSHVDVEVEPTDFKGRAWDRGVLEAAPDLGVEVLVDGARVGRCDMIDDTTHGTCKIDKPIDLTSTSVLALNVIDRDLAVDDPVGEARLDDPSDWALKQALPMSTAGQVRTATITLEAGPTWWARNAPSVVAGGTVVGAGAALLLLFLYRRRQRQDADLAPAPVAAPAPSYTQCTHCAKRIVATLAVCDHCGARQ